MDKDTFEKIEQKKAFFLLALEEFDGGTLDIEEMKADYEFLFQIIKEQQKEIVMLEGAVEQDQETKDRYAHEIGELISLNLWSARRLKHQTYKDFAYEELEKITGQKQERV